MAERRRASKGRTWVVVLAGGDGTRLQRLTRALHRTPLPKQYARILSSGTLLQHTVTRALAVAPPERIVIVCNRAHHELARAQAEAVAPGVKLLVQPGNRGTALGVMLPLAWIRARDPRAGVVILPSDHHFEQPRLFESFLATVAGSGLGTPTLVGFEAERAETEFGWIMPGARVREVDGRGVFRIERFVEKPDLGTALRLHGGGALWNSFVMVGMVERLWQSAARCLPAHGEALATAAARADEGPHGLEACYQGLRDANFSTDVLQRTTGLEVLAAPSFGWNDWGTPERVFASLAGTSALENLRWRLAASAA